MSSVVTATSPGTNNEASVRQHNMDGGSASEEHDEGSSAPIATAAAAAAAQRRSTSIGGHASKRPPSADEEQPLSRAAKSPRKMPSDHAINTPSTAGGKKRTATPGSATSRSSSNKGKPTYLEMVIAAIRELRDRNGSSLQAIHKAITANFFDGEASSVNRPLLNKTLRNAVQGDKLMKIRNSYKVNSDYAKKLKNEAARAKTKATRVAKAKLLKAKEKVKAVSVKTALLASMKEKAKAAKAKAAAVAAAAAEKKKKSEAAEKKRIEKERREKMLKERERKLLRSKMEDLALMREDKELGIKCEAPETPSLQSLLSVFPNTCPDLSFTAPSKLSNKTRVARQHAVECIDASVRCWDILFGRVNAAALLDDLQIPDGEIAAPSGTTVPPLVALTFENFLHTFAQCADNDNEPPATLWTVLEWLFCHLLEGSEALAMVPRNAMTLTYLSKMYVMNKLHRARQTIRDEGGEYDNVDDSISQSESQADEEDEDESMQVDKESVTGTGFDDDLTDEVLEELFPCGVPAYHRILLFLCEDLLGLPKVTEDVTKRVDARSDFLKQIKSAEHMYKKSKSQWENQQKEAASGDEKDMSKAKNNGKVNETGEKQQAPKKLMKKDYEGIVQKYLDLTGDVFSSKVSTRSTALGQDRHHGTYWLLPGQGILVLSTGTSIDLFTNAFLLTTPEDLSTLIKSLDRRGQRESSLLRRLLSNEGVSNFLPKPMHTPLHDRIAELKSNLELTTSARVRDTIMNEISVAESNLVPTRDDLSGLTSLQKPECTNITNMCRLLSSLVKRVGGLLEHGQISEMLEAVKAFSREMNGVNSSSMIGNKVAWRGLLSLLRTLQGALYQQSLQQLSHEHEKHKPVAAKYARLLSQLSALSVASTASIRKLLIEAIADIRACISKISAVIECNESQDSQDEEESVSTLSGAPSMSMLSSLLSDCRDALKLWRPQAANSTKVAVMKMIEKYEIDDVTMSPEDAIGNEVEDETISDIKVLLGAFDMDGGEKWLNFLEDASDCFDIDAVVTAVYAFNVTALNLVDEMEGGKVGLENQLDWYKNVGAKRTTRSAKAGRDTNSQDVDMPAHIADSSLWLRFETTDEYVFAKSLASRLSVNWPSRVLNVLDTDISNRLLSLNLKVVVPVDCGAKSVRLSLARASDCVDVGNYKLNDDVDKKVRRLWLESVYMMKKIGNMSISTDDSELVTLAVKEGEEK